jgi:hypothetical protein
MIRRHVTVVLSRVAAPDVAPRIGDTRPSNRHREQIMKCHRHAALTAPEFNDTVNSNSSTLKWGVAVANDE